MYGVLIKECVRLNALLGTTVVFGVHCIHFFKYIFNTSTEVLFFLDLYNIFA